MAPHTVEQKFARALDDLVAHVQQDRSVLAGILCGSLSHDTVWAKSDIDLVLVTIDDSSKIDSTGLSLYADGINVHATRMARAEFRKIAGRATHSSFVHSLLAKGRLLYTHDPTIADLFSDLSKFGARDAELQLLRAATGALPPLYKARKWFITRGDLNYTALWILYAATPLARIEVIAAGRIADREVIPQAIELNPDFFQIVYSDMLNAKKTRKTVQTALDAIDGYLATRTPSLFRLVLDHLRDVGEARSCTEIENYFKRNFDVGGVTTACEYLADQGLIAKVSTPVQLTRRSNVVVQELAFAYLREARDGCEDH